MFLSGTYPLREVSVLLSQSRSFLRIVNYMQTNTKPHHISESKVKRTFSENMQLEDLNVTYEVGFVIFKCNYFFIIVLITMRRFVISVH